MPIDYSRHPVTGLEPPAVILTDVDPARPRGEELLYVGATRATDHLLVLTIDPALVERGGEPVEA